MLQVLQAWQNKMHHWGAPQSVKWAWVAMKEDAGQSQWGEEEPLFLELETKDGAKVRTEMAGLEIPGNTAMELMEALWAQTMLMQGQVCIEEWLCAQMEQLLVSLDQHRSLQQELLEALHIMVWGFRHGLGSGLEAWTRTAMGWEEWSKGEEDEEQGQRHVWNDTLS